MSDQPNPIEGELVETSYPIAPAAEGINRELAAYRSPKLGYVSSIDMTTPEGENLFMRCMGKPELTLETAAGQILPVSHWWASPGMVPVANGDELEERIIVRLVLDDGRIFGFSSPITGRFWRAILAIKGLGPWTPPLRVQVGREKGKQTGSWYPLNLMPQQLSQLKGPKGK